MAWLTDFGITLPLRDSYPDKLYLVFLFLSLIMILDSADASAATGVLFTSEVNEDIGYVVRLVENFYYLLYIYFVQGWRNFGRWVLVFLFRNQAPALPF